MRSHLLKALPFVLAASFVQAQTLPQAMQQALDVHPEIQAGVNSRLAADYQLKAAKGGYLPRVDLAAGYGREGTDSVTTRSGGNNHWETLNRSESSLRLSQMVLTVLRRPAKSGVNKPPSMPVPIRCWTPPSAPV